MYCVFIICSEPFKKLQPWASNILPLVAYIDRRTNKSSSFQNPFTVRYNFNEYLYFSFYELHVYTYLKFLLQLRNCICKSNIYGIAVRENCYFAY